MLIIRKLTDLQVDKWDAEYSDLSIPETASFILTKSQNYLKKAGPLHRELSKMEIFIILLIMCGVIAFLAVLSLEPVKRFVDQALALTVLLGFAFFVSVVIYLLFA